MDSLLTLAAAVAVVGLSVNAAILAAELDKQDAALKSSREAHAMAAPATPIIQNSVYVFISFSMPKESLQQWAAQAKKVHAPLVIQGLVNDSFTKTQQAVAALSSEHQSGVVLDPRLFLAISHSASASGGRCASDCIETVSAESKLLAT